MAFEVLGLPQTFTQAFDMIRDGGRMVGVGIAPARPTAPIEITRLVRRELRIIGSYGARTRSDMPEIIRLAAQGIFRPETMVTQRFPLAEADAAIRRWRAVRSWAGYRRTVAGWCSPHVTETRRG